MKPQTDRKKLINRCDDEIRRIARLRAGGHCGRCEIFYTDLEAHHIFSRRHLSVRFNLDNIIMLCPECHRWAHSHPEEFQAVTWLDMGFIFDGLQEKVKQVVHYKNFELREILEGLKRNGG